jgi:hypothetical protein
MIPAIIDFSSIRIPETVVLLLELEVEVEEEEEELLFDRAYDERWLTLKIHVSLFAPSLMKAPPVTGIPEVVFKYCTVIV